MFAMDSVSIVVALVRFVCLGLLRDVPKASITHTIGVWALVEIVSSILRFVRRVVGVLDGCGRGEGGICSWAVQKVVLGLLSGRGRTMEVRAGV